MRVLSATPFNAIKFQYQITMIKIRCFFVEKNATKQEVIIKQISKSPMSPKKFKGIELCTISFNVCLMEFCFQIAHNKYNSFLRSQKN